MSDEIKGYLAQLRQVIPCVPPVATSTLQSLHKDKNYKGMVQLIKKSMNIEGVTIRVLWVPDGAANEGRQKDAPAWISLPPALPAYGSKAFREMTLDMCVRRSFLQDSEYDQVAILVAHELSHVVLESIAHPLRKVEKAVDLTAMLLGFRLLYQMACYKERRDGNLIKQQSLGYLTQAEADFASDMLSPVITYTYRPRHTVEQAPKHFVPINGRSWRSHSAAYSPLFAILCLFLLAGSIPAYRTWQLHEALVTEQRELQKRLPMNLNRYMLTDVRVGVREIARLYKLSVPEREIDFAAVERAVRKLSCNDDNKAKVRDGATYTYEFRDSRQIVRKFEIASCA